MSFAAIAFALALSASSSPASPSDPAQALVDSLVRAMTSGSYSELLPIAEKGDGVNWFWGDLDRYDCVTVRSDRFARESKDTLRLEIDASATTRSAAHKPVALPSVWILKVACDVQQCRLRSAETAEQHAARLL